MDGNSFQQNNDKIFNSNHNKLRRDMCISTTNSKMKKLKKLTYTNNNHKDIFDSLYENNNENTDDINTTVTLCNNCFKGLLIKEKDTIYCTENCFSINYDDLIMNNISLSEFNSRLLTYQKEHYNCSGKLYISRDINFLCEDCTEDFI